MTGPRFVRLSQLTDPRGRVTIRCKRCGRRPTYSAEEFRRMVPADLDSFADMERRLRCQFPGGCGQREAVVIGWIDIWADKK
jgi:hypothetical protein